MRKQADRKTVFDHVCRMQNDDDLEAFRLMKEGGLYRDLPSRLCFPASSRRRSSTGISRATRRGA